MDQDYHRHLDTVLRETAALADLATHDGLSRLVPSCPGWTLEDLVRHVGQVHRFARTVLDPGATTANASSTAEDLADWLRDGATALTDTLRRLNPASPTWTFDTAPGRVWFWARRQAVETALHRWDAETPARRSRIDDVTAIAGLDEAADSLIPRAIATAAATMPQHPLHLRAGERCWPIATGGDSSAEPVTVEAPPSELLLFVWGRHIPITDHDLSDIRLLG